MQDKAPQDKNCNRDQPQRQVGFNIGYVIVAMLLLWLFQDFVLAALVTQATEIPYSAFTQKLAGAQIVSAQIDEIDAIGESRAGGAVRFGVNDEREQTLNQLLAEIDGFKSGTSAPVIIMAATNHQRGAGGPVGDAAGRAGGRAGGVRPPLHRGKR